MQQRIEDILQRASDDDRSALSAMISSRGWTLFNGWIDEQRISAHLRTQARSSAGAPGVDNSIGFEHALELIQEQTESIKREVQDGEPMGTES